MDSATCPTVSSSTIVYIGTICSGAAGHVLSLHICRCPTFTREAVSDACAALLAARWLILPDCACELPQGAALLASAGILADV